MANKKISELTTRTPSLSDLMLVGDPSSGYSFKCTVTALATIIETDIADGYVTLGTAQTISGAKTFSNNLTLTSVSNAGVDTDKFLVLSGSNVVNFRTGAEVLSDIGAQAALTNPITGTGTSGQVAYFNGTNSITSSPTFAFTPTSQLLVNNSVTASSSIARGINATPTLTAAANNDILVGLDINPTFTIGAQSNVTCIPLRLWQPLNQYGELRPYIHFKYSDTYDVLRVFMDASWRTNFKSSGGSGSGFNFITNLATNALTILSNGNVAINSGTDAGFRLDVNGTARLNNSVVAQTVSSVNVLDVGDVRIAADANGRYIQAANGITLRQTTTTGNFINIGQLSDANTWGSTGSITIRPNSTAVNNGFTFSSVTTAPSNNTLTFNRNRNDGVKRAIINTPDFSSSGISNEPVNFLIYPGAETSFGVQGNIFLSHDGTNARGNVIIGSATNDGARLQVTGSITAASAIARGVNFTNTLVAAANNDVLVGLDVNPTFTNGAFTGVSNLAARISGILAGVTQYWSTGASSQAHYLELVSSSTTNAVANFRRNAGAAGTYAYQLSNGSAYFSYNASSGETTLFASSGGGFLNFYSGGTEAMRIFSSTRNVLIQNGGTFTDAGFRLDVNGTARVQGVITGSVNNGTLTLGAASTNTVAISLSGAFTGNGAIEVTNSNPRGFINRINAQGEAGYFIQSNSANFQSVAHQINFFRAGNALTIANPVVGSEVNGFYFNPTISGQGVAAIYAFRGSLASSTDRWNLYMDGTAQNYLAGNLMIGTTTAGGRFTIQPTNDQVGMSISGSSLTGSNAQSLVSLSQTWNTTGNPTAFLLNITNTASGNNSYLLDLQVGGIPQFTVFKGGEIKTSSPAGGVAQTWKLGSVQAVTPTSPNRTIEVEVNGTTYYIHAKTTND